MDRYAVSVTISEPADGDAADLPDGTADGPVAISPGLMSRLGLTAHEPTWLCFGQRRRQVQCAPEPALTPNRIRMDPAVARSLCVTTPLQLSIYRRGAHEVALGPLVGLLIARPKLQAALDGWVERVYARYARYARETGAVLFFFTADAFDGDHGLVRGYRLNLGVDGEERWEVQSFPIPRVIYDRAFGPEGREEGRTVRLLARTHGSTVINQTIKITKLQASEVLATDPRLARHLPFTAPLTPDSLRRAMTEYSDLYLKPNALYKGEGVYRLTRQADGWVLQTRKDWGNACRFIADAEEARTALAHMTMPGADHLVQEGLPVAIYLGNRFDFRSLVQKDGQGVWSVTGLVARIAPVDSVITSPRSGGLVATPDAVLQHCFPDTWRRVAADIEQVSLAIAGRIDEQLGPCVELGLDLGVLPDGSVNLIEVNGKPLKVSLQRLRDPAVSERIYRFPIHHAAYLDTREAEGCVGCE